jgi:uncharacterized damage-inducible protein DinB
MTYYSGPDLARSFRTVRRNTLQIAQEIPESQYDFRVAPETRSVSETLIHIASQPRWHQRLHGVDKKTHLSFEDFHAYMKEVSEYAATIQDRAAILRALEQDGEEFASWLETLSDAALGEMVGFAPGSTPASKSRFEMLLGAKEHEMHHRAQLMVVQRMIGIVPHLTRARQQR